MEWAFSGYIGIFGNLFWPLFFAAILGYIYLKNQSLTVMAVAILIIVAVFGEILALISPFYNFLLIVVTLVITIVILLFFVRRG
jgi:hypothetical protein